MNTRFHYMNGFFTPSTPGIYRGIHGLERGKKGISVFSPLFHERYIKAPERLCTEVVPRVYRNYTLSSPLSPRVYTGNLTGVKPAHR